MFHNKTGLYFILVSSCFFSFHTKTNKASAKNFIYIQYIYIYIYIYTIWTFPDKTREHKIYEDVDLDLKINKL